MPTTGNASAPATAWRYVLLDVIRLDSEDCPKGKPWSISAGQFADENADTLRTTLVRGLAEGRMASLQLTEEDGSSVVATRAAEQASATVGADTSARAEALAQIEIAWDTARNAAKTAERARDFALRFLNEAEAQLAEARVDADRLRGLVTSLRGAAPRVGA